MAAIWHLPVLYMCENNQYGMGTDFRRVSAVDDFSVMGTSYGIKGRQVDGMDVLAVYTAVSAEVNRIRKEGSPGFMEIKTYRYKGHSMSDPARYRTKEEVEAYRRQDPILLLKVQMIQNGMLDDAAYEEMDTEVKNICRAAVEYAESGTEPEPQELYQDVYA
jgi:pyruvate dehydrogenase E1 component alpha subunit